MSSPAAPPVDVLIVGGGIGGSALALVLARRGRSVTVLERQRAYQDRVRGEYMQPWGVAEARELQILDLLIGAGGHYLKWQIPYDETIPPQVAKTAVMDVTQFRPDVVGPLCVGHPAACRALSAAAEAAGARYVRGVDSVQIHPGQSPEVEFDVGGTPEVVKTRLIVGADGRSSTVRAQAGIPLERDEPTHLISGMLVDGVASWPQDAFSIGTEREVMFFVFPQGDQRMRLYTCTELDQRERYAGSQGPSRFLDDFRQLTCVLEREDLASGKPIGPCATYGGEDTWADLPLADGVALIGDAAGYDDPVLGQGLSLALRDVRVLSTLLLAESTWSTEKLMPYAEERREYLRRLRLTAATYAALGTTFGPDGAARRARFFARSQDQSDPAALALAAAILGPDNLPAWAFTEEYRRTILE